MKKYNAISLETGRIRKSIMATSYDSAVEIISNIFNCYAEDNFLIELAEDTEHYRSLQPRFNTSERL